MFWLSLCLRVSVVKNSGWLDISARFAFLNIGSNPECEWPGKSPSYCRRPPPRPALWLWDRDGIKGHFGEPLRKPPSDEDEEEAETDTPVEKKETIGSAGTIPDRHIYTLDFRDAKTPGTFVEEVRRIIAE